MEVKEHIVLTPIDKTSNSTTLRIERKVENAAPGSKMYVAGGDHQGIIINKEKKNDDNNIIPPPNLSLEFRVYLVNAQTGMHSQELRTLRFWFRHVLESETEQATVAQEFFRDLIEPKEFPRDYVGFIKKLMKLLQHGFHDIVRIELVLCQLKASELPERPPSADYSNSEKTIELTEEKVVEIVEHYYPNPITIQDLSREYDWDEGEIRDVLGNLEGKGIIKSMDHGGYTRVTQGDNDVKIVKQMPKMVRAHQPTIAIITAQFAEKLAVDAMIDNRETFVRYTTIGSDNGGTRTRFGESNVYTLGNIGETRIVCTKLPSVGHTREAMIAAGNTTTRLLGTFQNVDHVILVGAGGGVPHFIDYNRHVRLGDVVISHAPSDVQFGTPDDVLSPPLYDPVSLYISCEGATEIKPGVFEFDTKEYQPKNALLQSIAAQLKKEAASNNGERIWECLEEGLQYLELESEHNFHRPPSESDKLYMAIGERDLIEVSHPLPQDYDSVKTEGRPRLHLGIIGAGREIARSDHLRQKFSQQHHISAFVPEFDPVIQSVIGNCRDSFILVRGISDYKDGSKKTEWQAYAALVAAAVTKAIITCLDSIVQAHENDYA